MSHAKEIREQAKAFQMMHGDVLDLIAKYAAEFRDIINGYEALHGKEPTAEDLVYIASQHHGRDLTKEG